MFIVGETFMSVYVCVATVSILSTPIYVCIISVLFVDSSVGIAREGRRTQKNLVINIFPSSLLLFLR